MAESYAENFLAFALNNLIYYDLTQIILFIHRLQQSMYEADYGSKDSTTYPERLSVFCDKLQKEGTISKSCLTPSDQLVCVLITPLMQRCLEGVIQANELMFVDSTGNCDRHGVRIFLLLTHCAAGGVPIGCILTTSETEETLSFAFELYKTMLPTSAFPASVSHGPDVIMTDDCDEERAALRKAFPDALLLLCIFHVLQAGWRWLNKTEHHIPKEKRQDLYYRLKSLLYAESEEVMHEVF